MQLLIRWYAGPYLYQVWDTDTEYVCECIHEDSLRTLCKGRGNSPVEAIEDGVREAMRKGMAHDH